MPGKQEVKQRFEQLVENLKAVYGLSFSEIMELSSGPAEGKTFVPLEVFSSKLGILEALTVYLKEEKRMRFVDIARVLERDQRTIWTTYHNARRKLHGKQ